MSSLALSLPPLAFRRVLWRFPEAWVWAVSIGCGILLLLPASTAAEGHHHGHPGPLELSRFLGHWIPMVFAMMVPLQTGQLRLVAQRSLWRRRHLAMALYLCGFVLPWAACGLIVWAGTQYLPIPPATWMVLAAAWQLTAYKRRALGACHRTRTLSPSGWPANRDCLLAGLLASRACLASCWLLMAACGAFAHGLLLMIGLTIFMWVERLADRPRQVVYATALLGLAGVMVLLQSGKHH